MVKFIDLTTMTGDFVKVNMDWVVAIMPATKEDKESRPKVNAYVVLAGGSEKILNVQQTPDEILARAGFDQ